MMINDNRFETYFSPFSFSYVQSILGYKTIVISSVSACPLKPDGYNVCKWHYEFCSAYWLFRQPVHIRIHAQMHLAGTSLCQRCLLPDEIPSAPSKHHKVSAFRRTMQCFLSNIGKTVLIVKRKTCVLELQHFKVNQILFLFQ